MSAMDGSRNADEKPRDGLVAFLLENRTLVNFASIIMLVFAVWATVEVITNSLGMTWWPPETGIPSEDIYNNPDDLNNINNGWIIGLGAICGTVGFMIQYFYRAAPHVDASMKATAALIISAVKVRKFGLHAQHVNIGKRFCNSDQNCMMLHYFVLKMFAIFRQIFIKLDYKNDKHF